jgi:D-sedoheptulose 7-phosphate isomerase
MAGTDRFLIFPGGYFPAANNWASMSEALSLNTPTYASRYFRSLDRIARNIEATGTNGIQMDFDAAMERFTALCCEVQKAGRKLMFIGNGGSASIASHMATDFMKNGHVRATAFNDPMVLTCLGNDLGYERVFEFQLENHAEPGDLLIAISSSGRSANILNGVAAARSRKSKVVTLSGFGSSNPLRGTGDLNLYVPCGEYGFVELLHCSLVHCALDCLMGIEAD